MIHEIYASIQGESTYAGRPCAFVRLTGCPLRCAWCDTQHAFSGGERMDIAAILERLDRLGMGLVEVTGGEPLAQPNCYQLLKEICDAGYEVLLETSGAFDIAPVDPRVATIVDLKCPASGEAESNRWANYDCLDERDEIKCVVANRADYDWAVRTLGELGALGRRTILFSPVADALDPGELGGWILADKLPARLQLQLHKYCWPGQDRAV